MSFTTMTGDVEVISKLPNVVSEQPETLKGSFDEAPIALKTWDNNHVAELEAKTAAASLGAVQKNGTTASTVQIELNSLNGEIDDIKDGTTIAKKAKQDENGDEIDVTYLKVATAASTYQTIANKATSFQTTPSDDKYPTEKLAKDSLDTKYDKAQGIGNANKNVITDSGGNLAFEDKTTITLNGGATKTPSFYAPTSAGDSGKVLRGNSSGAPSWVTAPTGIIVEDSLTSTSETQALSANQGRVLNEKVSGGTLGVGDIKFTSETITDENWLECNGSSYDGGEYPDLATKLGLTIPKNWTTGVDLTGTTAYPLFYKNGYWITARAANMINYTNDLSSAYTEVAIASAGAFKSIDYDGTNWVAVFDNGVYTATSLNGTWTKVVTSTYIKSVAYNGTHWVAVGAAGNIYYATNPTSTWTSNTQGSAAFTKVIYANNTWVTAGLSGAIYYATDPTGAWTQNTQSGNPTEISNILYEDGIWIISIYASSGGLRLFYSSDISGIFAKINLPLSETSYIKDFLKCEDYFIAVLYNINAIMYAKNITGSWQRLNIPAVTSSTNYIAYDSTNKIVGILGLSSSTTKIFHCTLGYNTPIVDFTKAYIRGK